jgi:hypothetical protein
MIDVAFALRAIERLSIIIDPIIQIIDWFELLDFILDLLLENIQSIDCILPCDMVNIERCLW